MTSQIEYDFNFKDSGFSIDSNFIKKIGFDELERRQIVREYEINDKFNDKQTKLVKLELIIYKLLKCYDENAIKCFIKYKKLVSDYIDDIMECPQDCLSFNDVDKQTGEIFLRSGEWVMNQQCIVFKDKINNIHMAIKKMNEITRIGFVSWGNRLPELVFKFYEFAND